MGSGNTVTPVAPRTGTTPATGTTGTPATPTTGTGTNQAPGSTGTPTGPNPPATNVTTAPQTGGATPATPTGGRGNISISTNYIAAVSGDVAFVKKPDGSWSRGWIKTFAEPTDKGCRLRVESGHQTKDEKLTLALQARVRQTIPDPNNPGKTMTEEKIIVLDVLHNGVLNKHGFENVANFELDYDKINAYLAQYQPGLQLSPGTPLAVFAVWEVGHQWGGYARDGIVYIPQRLKNPLQAGSGSGANDPMGGPVPLDIGVQIPEDVVRSYMHYGNGANTEVLARDGQFMSRVESEVKVSVPYGRGAEVAQKVIPLVRLSHEAHELAEKAKTDPSFAAEARAKADQVKAEAARIFGAGWSLELQDVKRFYQFDAKGNFVLDADGLPVVMPMLDRYYDSADGKLAQKGIALRFRETPKDPMGLVNIKMPSPADLPNPTGLVGLIGRYDTGIQTVKGIRSTPEALANFFDSTEHLNAFKYIREAIPGLTAKDVLQPAMDLTTRRYKLMLEHTSGTSIELSLDHVTAVALDDKGEVRLDKNKKPMVATFWQLELDLEHLQTQSSNAVQNAGSAGVGNLGQFYNDTEQAEWLKKLAPNASLSGPPRIHRPEDVRNPSITDSDAYRLLLGTGPRLHKWLLPDGAQPAMQKYAMAARMVGIVPFSAEEQRRYSRELEVSHRARDAYAKTYKDPEAEADKVLAAAQTKSDAVKEAGERIASKYTNLRYGSSYNSTVNAGLSGLEDALGKRNDALVTPNTPAGERKRAGEQATKAIEAFEAALTESEALIAAYETSRVAAGLKPSDAEKKTLGELRGAYAAVLKAYDDALAIRQAAETEAGSIVARAPNDAQAAQRARLVREDGGKRAAALIQTAHDTATARLGTAGDSARFRGEAVSVMAIAEAKATELRSNTVWRAVDGAR